MDVGDALTGLALLLGFFTLFLQYFNPGRVVLAMPLGVALREGPQTGAGTVDWTAIWRMKLALCNTGARARVVHNLRLTVRHEARKEVLRLAQWKETVMPGTHEDDLAQSGDLASAFVIPPAGGTVERVAVFKPPIGWAERWLQRAGTYQCTIEALLPKLGLAAAAPQWQRLSMFEVSLTEEHCAVLGSRQWSFAESVGPHDN